VQQQTRTSLSVIHEALARYKLSELSLSYNGGKDCLVLLVLFLSRLPASSPQPEPQQRQQETHPPPPKIAFNEPNGTADSSGTSHWPATIPAIYALPPHPFPSVESFVRSSSQTYHLSLTRYTTDPPSTTLRSAFASYLSLHPSIRGIFVGTRRTDPHGATLTHFDPTDHGWPDFMRIHPVIDWHYAEIWAFIRHLGVEYCALYDEGYTSLGGTNDTHPNPKLRMEQSSDMNRDSGEGYAQKYRPAYELVEDGEERLGRV
jgi:FAD synthetase